MAEGNRREIKFRAWDKKCIGPFSAPYMYYFNILDSFAEEDICFFECQSPFSLRGTDLDKMILMQFTGLTDKNDKEVYEGAVIKYEISCGAPSEPHQGIAQIEFGCSDMNGWVFNDFKNNIVRYFEEPYWDFEVIGNIYENPELLK